MGQEQSSSAEGVAHDSHTAGREISIDVFGDQGTKPPVRVPSINHHHNNSSVTSIGTENHMASVPHACLAAGPGALGPRICTCPTSHSPNPQDAPSPSPLMMEATRGLADNENNLPDQDSGFASSTQQSPKADLAEPLKNEIASLRQQIMDMETTHTDQIASITKQHQQEIQAIEESRTAQQQELEQLRIALTTATQQQQQQQEQQQHDAANATTSESEVRLAEELATLKAEISKQEEVHASQIAELETKIQTLQSTDETRNALNAAALQEAQAKISALEQDKSNLSAEIEKLRPQCEDYLVLKARVEQEAAERAEAEREAAANKNVTTVQKKTLSAKFSDSFSKSAHKMEKELNTLKKKFSRGPRGTL